MVQKMTPVLEQPTRRGLLLLGLGGFVLAAPAIVRASSLMAVKDFGSALRVHEFEVVKLLTYGINIGEDGKLLEVRCVEERDPNGWVTWRDPEWEGDKANV